MLRKLKLFFFRPQTGETWAIDIYDESFGFKILQKTYQFSVEKYKYSKDTIYALTNTELELYLHLNFNQLGNIYKVKPPKPLKKPTLERILRDKID